MKNTGLLLHSHRVARDLTQTYVAKRLKVTLQFYGQVEKGRSPLPAYLFKRVIRILRIPEGYLTQSLVSDYLEKVNKYL